MLKTIESVGVALVIATVAASARAGAIDDELGAVLAETPPDQPVSAIVFLANQVDIGALEAEFTRLNARLQFRHEKVVTELQKMAAATQGDLLAYIAEREAAGDIESHHAFWISNAVAVKALPAGIRAIADRQDVGIVFFDYGIELIKPVEGIPGVQGAGGVSTGDITIGVQAVRAPEVWNMGIEGTGVLIATLDTGVDGNHEALASRWRGVADERYTDNPEWAWFDPVTGTDFPEAFSAHGTHTMGSVLGGPPGEHIGVAPGAQWIHAAVIDRTGGNTIEDALLAFEWMLDPDGDPSTNWDVPAVCSNSWRLVPGFGLEPCDETFWDHLDACEAAGILIVFSAGNEGFAGLGSPPDRASDAFRTLAVGAVDANEIDWPIAGFSSRGPSNCRPGGGEAIKPDIAAPGVNVRSALPDNSYGDLSGTSMSSPHVNGVVALMREANPELSVDDIKLIIYQTAHDLGDEGEDNNYGWGMIDALEAVQMAQDFPGTIRFGFPDGLPDRINPTGGKRVRVEVSGTNIQPEPGTGKVYFFEDDEWVEVAMEVIEDNVYDAVFSAAPCNRRFHYYFSAETTEGDIVTNPFNAPDDTHSAIAMIGFADFFSDDFEDDLGWTVVNENLEDGAWERGIPFRGGGRGAPPLDFDGSGKCWITGNVTRQDVDGGPTRLISPVFDLDGGEFLLSYARWRRGSDSEDLVAVEVSNDHGQTWVLIEEWSSQSNWEVPTFNVTDFIATSTTMQFRFSAGDFGADSILEAAIDAFSLTRVLCEDPGGCKREPEWLCDGDVDGDGQVNPVDSGLVQAAFGSTDEQDVCNYDVDCDGQINPVDSGIVQSLFGTCNAPRAACP